MLKYTTKYMYNESTVYKLYLLSYYQTFNFNSTHVSSYCQNTSAIDYEWRITPIYTGIYMYMYSHYIPLPLYLQDYSVRRL